MQVLYSAVVLIVLVSNVALGQAPVYTAANIVNASDYATGPFAPNSVLSLFGSNLSWSTHILSSDDIAANTLPISLANVEVYVDNYPAPLLYVSPLQINFLIPGNEISGDVTVRVAREGVSGPLVTIALVDSAPAVFDLGNGFILAAHADGSVITPSAPALPGETMVVYVTGLGRTQPNPAPGEIPQYAASILNPGSLTVSMDGSVLEWFRIKYAGVTPLSVGLYQINIELPPTAGPNPGIVVTIGGQSSPAGLCLAVQ